MTTKPAWWSWIVRILPELEEQTLYSSFDFSTDSFDSARRTQRITLPLARLSNLLGCPEDPTAHRVGHPDCNGQFWCDRAYTNYLGVTGTQGGPTAIDNYKADGMFPDTNVCVELRSVTDGTSHTLFVGERPVVDFFR